MLTITICMVTVLMGGMNMYSRLGAAPMSRPRYGHALCMPRDIIVHTVRCHGVERMVQLNVFTSICSAAVLSAICELVQA